jgi:hypothetical protein
MYASALGLGEPIRHINASLFYSSHTEAATYVTAGSERVLNIFTRFRSRDRLYGQNPCKA